MINTIIASLVAAIVGAVAAGLLIAAAVEWLALYVGHPGALGIVGGVLLLVAVVIVLVGKGGRHHRAESMQQHGLDMGGVVSGFLIGLWDGFTKPRRDR